MWPDVMDANLVDDVLEPHTSNSWRRFHFSHAGAACEPITQQDGHPDLHFPGGFEGPVARRFLATWNACRGIRTDTLERIDRTPANHYALLKRDCDDLREALRVLSVLVLQSDSYRTDMDIRDAVDSGLVLSGQTRSAR